MYRRVIYTAGDGMEFDNETQCRAHEQQMELISVKDDIIFVDDRGEKLPLDREGFLSVSVIKCKTDAAAKFLYRTYEDEIKTPWEEYHMYEGRAGCWFYDSDRNMWISAEDYLEPVELIQKVLEM